MDFESIDISDYSRENCAYFIRDEYVFLIHRAKKGDPVYNKLIGIGGKNNPDEIPLDAVIREIIEETDISIHDFISENVKLIKIGTLLMHDYKKSIDIWIAETEIKPRLLDHREGKGKFYHKDIIDLQKEKFMPGDRIFWNCLFNKESFKVDVINKKTYLNGKLIEND